MPSPAPSLAPSPARPVPSPEPSPARPVPAAQGESSARQGGFGHKPAQLRTAQRRGGKGGTADSWPAALQVTSDTAALLQQRVVTGPSVCPPSPRPALTCARGPSGSRQVAKIQAGGRGEPSSCFTSSRPMPRLEPVSSTVRAAAIAARGPARLAPPPDPAGRTGLPQPHRE